MSERVLMVEDDPHIGERTAADLTQQGFVVTLATDGQKGLNAALSGEFDCIILDRMLPGMDGVEVLRRLRAANVATPVVMLSALGDVDDRIDGLDAGADDYLPKPFAVAELVARLKAAMRKKGGSATPATVLSHGPLTMDLIARTAHRGDRALVLQPREFQLLEYFLRHADEVVTRTMLLRDVWNMEFDLESNVIDVHISRLRRKLEGEGESALIQTERGVGYRLTAA